LQKERDVKDSTEAEFTEAYRTDSKAACLSRSLLEPHCDFALAQACGFVPLYSLACHIPLSSSLEACCYQKILYRLTRAARHILPPIHNVLQPKHGPCDFYPHRAYMKERLRRSTHGKPVFVSDLYSAMSKCKLVVLDSYSGQPDRSVKYIYEHSFHLFSFFFPSEPRSSTI
jgi:hypothetical protein